jgi:hypothetical protein
LFSDCNILGLTRTCRVADDFVVPPGKRWRIEEAWAIGVMSIHSIIA